jgi:hypothetical protein
VIDENTFPFFFLFFPYGQKYTYQTKKKNVIFVSFSLLEAIRRQNDWHNLLIRLPSNTECQQKQQLNLMRLI